MFEEVCFKASFDNREGRAVTETKGREFQTWTAGKLFSFEEGDVEGSII